MNVLLKVVEVNPVTFNTSSGTESYFRVILKAPRGYLWISCNEYSPFKVGCIQDTHTCTKMAKELKANDLVVIEDFEARQHLTTDRPPEYIPFKIITNLQRSLERFRDQLVIQDRYGQKYLLSFTSFSKVYVKIRNELGVERVVQLAFDLELKGDTILIENDSVHLEKVEG